MGGYKDRRWVTMGKSDFTWGILIQMDLDGEKQRQN